MNHTVSAPRECVVSAPLECMVSTPRSPNPGPAGAEESGHTAPQNPAWYPFSQGLILFPLEIQASMAKEDLAINVRTKPG